MMEEKRDQRSFDLVQKHLSPLMLSTILEIIEEMSSPYRIMPGLSGPRGYPPKAMAIVCFLMEFEKKTYRKMVSYLEGNPDLVRRIGLPRVPSKNTIWRAYKKIPESYLSEFNSIVIRDILPGSLAGDSTGYNNNRFTQMV